MYEPSTYIEIAYFFTYLPMYDTYSVYKIGCQDETKCILKWSSSTTK
jgi:hypothetical protein